MGVAGGSVYLRMLPHLHIQLILLRRQLSKVSHSDYLGKPHLSAASSPTHVTSLAAV